MWKLFLKVFFEINENVKNVRAFSASRINKGHRGWHNSNVTPDNDIEPKTLFDRTRSYRCVSDRVNCTHVYTSVVVPPENIQRMTLCSNVTFTRSYILTSYKYCSVRVLYVRALFERACLFPCPIRMWSDLSDDREEN